MGFKIRDLMISVLPSTARRDPEGCNICTGTTGELFTVGGCNVCTGTVPTGRNADFGCRTCTGTTGGACQGCPACTGTTGDYGCPACTGTTNALCAHAAVLAACGICTGVSPALGDRRPEALALLRQQLEGLLAEVAAEEKRLTEASFPKTTEEAEDLEKKLEEALAEVRSRKAGLKKKKG
jgi:hypothetical protein